VVPSKILERLGAVKLSNYRARAEYADL